MTMAPSIERSNPKSTTGTMSSYTGSSPVTYYPPRKPILERKTVAFAVNYEASMVDRYFSAPNGNKSVKFQGTFNPTPVRTAMTPTSRATNDTKGDSQKMSSSIAQPNIIAAEDEGSANSSHDASSDSRNKRRSTREQKQRSVNMTQVKVRYDMELVPSVERPNLSFWNDVHVWPPRVLKDPPPPAIMPSPINSGKTPVIAAPPVQTAPTPVPPSNPPPLQYSVIWEPTKRKEWEDSVSELTAVCTSAALRKHTTGKFFPPLSREYIRDRIDIDDPLRGYQLRHATGGWLQGFCLWTNFTTWTHYFTWDSLHKESGMADVPYPKDEDGSLSRELQALPRSGDPAGSGIVFEKVAEIALLGGLGCGELMLRMALEDILKSEKYKYVVLQATKGSRAFYERFGFQRVGAVCRYGSSAPQKSSDGKAKSNSKATTSRKIDWMVPTLDTPIQGYRHWTHANESQHSLELHGGPSYMMCLRLPETPVQGLNLLDHLASCFVSEKPTIEPLGAASTPNPKRKLKRASSNSLSSTPPLPNLDSSSAPLTGDVYSNITRGGSYDEDAVSSPFTVEMSNKRRKVSMDKLELGNASALADNYPMPASTNSTAKAVGRPPKHGTTAVATRRQKGGKTSGQVSSTESGKSGKVLKSRVTASGTSDVATSASPNEVLSGESSTTRRIKGSTVSDAPEVVHNQAVPTVGIQNIDRASLVKQKVKSYPRDRLHFYNKVVARKGSGNAGPFYFVLNYDAEKGQITMCPMSPKGILSGKRQGRPRYQCDLLSTSANWIVNASTDLYEPVPAFMVMKTPLIAQEAWDIMGEP